MTARVTKSAPDWVETTRLTDWQRERASGPILPMEAEFRGPWALLTWFAIFVVVTLLICAVLS